VYRKSSDQPADKSALQAMCCAIAHRGPDAEGYYQHPVVSLGMRRLSIIDLAGGQQPIWNEGQTCCIIFNGEIYNFRELRPELEARRHRFHTHSDTEVILHAYEEWGPDCLRRLNGMFAVAIWDERRRLLMLARDRIGEKPLYYYQDQRQLVFGSEIKAILANRAVPRALNPRGLANFLAFGHAIAPETMYQQIFKLLPGHYLLAKDGQIQIVKYWEIGEEAQIDRGAHLTEQDCAQRILALLEDSVKRRMIADVPLGAFLSGGVDSSAIVALMMRNATGPVKTFSLGFSVGGAYNELAEAREVARYLGTEHYELQVEHVDLIETLRTLVYHYDEPFGDAAGFPIYLLSQFAREHVKVVLSGDGGDELFGGYRRYAADQLAPLYQLLPRPLIETWAPGLVTALPRLRRTKRLAQTLPIRDAACRYSKWLELFTPEMRGDLLQQRLLDAIADHNPSWPYPKYYHGLNGSSASDHLNRLMFVDLKTWLADVYMEKLDKATMARSLEARLPLLDHRLVELAFQIPGGYKIKGSSMKRVFKHAVQSLVPDAVLRRPKHGFAVPTDPWFRGELKEFAFDVLLDRRAQQRGYFNAPVVERLWHEHVRGRGVWDTQLWLLLNFELWHRIFLDGETV
jgi:asparagine synthase (glutamine-hydrolysing)